MGAVVGTMSINKVFVYGSLLARLHNAHHLRTSLLLRPGARTKASEYVLVDSCEGYPFAIHASKVPERPKSMLSGEVYEVSQGVLATLDELEGNPTFYCREQVELEGEDGTAWMYLLADEAWVDAIRSDADGSIYRDVEPLGDWRTYRRTAVAAKDAQSTVAASSWLSTKRTSQGEGPFAVFSFGSNGINQLRERCKNPSISGTPAVLEDAVRIFGGVSKRWGNGAVASIAPCPGQIVLGNVAHLTASELLLLDEFERGSAADGVIKGDDPYAPDGHYRRQDIIVRCQPSEGRGVEASVAPALPEDAVDWPLLEAVAYVWSAEKPFVRPPSTEYVAACRANVDAFWAGQSELPVRVRDHTYRLMAEM